MAGLIIGQWKSLKYRGIMTRFNFTNKYQTVKTYSNIIGRKFDSKTECKRAEQLFMLEKQGAIKDLEFQVPFQLCLKPNIKIRVDFRYTETSSGRVILEDSKGVMTRESRVKFAWLKEKFGVDVFITGKDY